MRLMPALPHCRVAIFLPISAGRKFDFKAETKIMQQAWVRGVRLKAERLRKAQLVAQRARANAGGTSPYYARPPAPARGT